MMKIGTILLNGVFYYQMKILFLNKYETKILIALIKKIIKENKWSVPYELTTILEKLSDKEYQALWNNMAR